MHSQIPAEPWLAHQLTASFDFFYMVLELYVEMLYFSMGLTTHLFIKMTWIYSIS